MPIIGLTDSTPSFKELGRLRLGIPKSEATKGGPKEIGYFRADFRPDCQDAAQLFREAYTTAPTAINVRFPFEEIERGFDAFYEVYNRAGLVGRSDGVKWLYLRNTKTNALIVSGGLPEMPFDKNTPVYAYRGKGGEEVPVFAKPTGRLQVVIPELRRAAYVTVITHSLYNCARIPARLRAIQVIGANLGIKLPMIPMVLSRRMETISVNFDGKKSYQDHYLLELEISPAWMEQQFSLLERLEVAQLAQLAAPVVMPVTPEPEDVIENEPEQEETADPIEVALDDEEPETNGQLGLFGGGGLVDANHLY